MNEVEVTEPSHELPRPSPPNSKRKGLRFFYLLNRSLPDIKTYRILRALHLTTLRRSASRYLNSGKEIDVEVLEKQAYLKMIYERRVVGWYVVLPLIIILAALGFYSIQPLDAAKIYVDISVSSVSFQTNKPYVFQNGDIDSSNLSEAIILNASVTSEGMSSPANTQASIKADKDDILNLKMLTIPENADVWIYKPQPAGLEMIVQQKGEKEVTGEVDVYNGQIISDTSVFKFSSTAEERIPSAVSFRKDFQDNINFSLSMANTKWFELPKIYTNGITSFNNKNALNEKSTSAIISGSIHFLDTENDSLVLKRGDSLKIGFKNKPVKLSILADYNAIHVSFEAEVDELLAGPEILGDSDKLNQMPLRIKKLYYKAPYLWAILIAVLPILLPYLLRQRQDAI